MFPTKPSCLLQEQVPDVLSVSHGLATSPSLLLPLSLCTPSSGDNYTCLCIRPPRKRAFPPLSAYGCFLGARAVFEFQFSHLLAGFFSVDAVKQCCRLGLRLRYLSHFWGWKSRQSQCRLRARFPVCRQGSRILLWWEKSVKAGSRVFTFHRLRLLVLSHGGLASQHRNLEGIQTFSS